MLRPGGFIPSGECKPLRKQIDCQWRLGDSKPHTLADAFSVGVQEGLPSPLEFWRLRSPVRVTVAMASFPFDHLYYSLEHNLVHAGFVQPIDTDRQQPVPFNPTGDSSSMRSPDNPFVLGVLQYIHQWVAKPVGFNLLSHSARSRLNRSIIILDQLSHGFDKHCVQEQ